MLSRINVPSLHSFSPALPFPLPSCLGLMPTHLRGPALASEQSAPAVVSRAQSKVIYGTSSSLFRRHYAASQPVQPPTPVPVRRQGDGGRDGWWEEGDLLILVRS